MEVLMSLIAEGYFSSYENSLSFLNRDHTPCWNAVLSSLSTVNKNSSLVGSFPASYFAYRFTYYQFNSNYYSHTTQTMPPSRDDPDDVASAATSHGTSAATSLDGVSTVENRRGGIMRAALSKLFKRFEKDATGTVHRAWGAAVLLMLLFFIYAIIVGTSIGVIHSMIAIWYTLISSPYTHFSCTFSNMQPTNYGKIPIRPSHFK